MSFHFPACFRSLGFFLCLSSASVTNATAQDQDQSLAAAQDQYAAAGPTTELSLQTLKSYCYDCHTGDGAEGGIRVDIFEPGTSLENHVELVEKVILVLKEQQMPPADSEQPSSEQRVKTLEWMETRLQEFDCGTISRPGRVTMRRLNRSEYNNTIRDLTGHCNGGN